METSETAGRARKWYVSIASCTSTQNLNTSQDVTDLAWSPGDRYLASVGLDSAVMIWCGYTLGMSKSLHPPHPCVLNICIERLRKIDQHQGFVKGVCWDPVGEFLATGSDDRSVRIWRTTDWELEAEVKKPFDHSPGTFFRRLR